MKTDAQGHKLGNSPYDVNPAGFSDSQRHSLLPCRCALHNAHAHDGWSRGPCKADGLRYDNFYAALVYGRVAQHDFEGVATNSNESVRLVRSLANRDILLLRNHGLLVCGQSLPSAFETMWFPQRACEVQLASDLMAGKSCGISESALRRNSDQYAPMTLGQEPGLRIFDATIRHAGMRYADLA